MGKKIHNKLVRDKIPTYLMAKGIQCRARVLSLKDNRVELRKKLVEECAEYFAAKKRASRLEELADVQEVVYALAELDGCSPEELEKNRLKKQAEKGGFGDRIFLIETNE
jgi:predicted house-cleaning noncanonical NTP pyrophosphatase (MazG superfamily)